MPSSSSFARIRADAVVKPGDHRCVNRVVLRILRVGLSPELRDRLRLTLPGEVHRELGKIEEKGPAAVRLDEFLGFGGEAVREVIVGRPTMQIGQIPWAEIRCRLSLLRSADIEIEAMLVGIERRTAKVPLANAGGSISERLEHLRNDHFFQRELVLELGRARREEPARWETEAARGSSP